MNVWAKRLLLSTAVAFVLLQGCAVTRPVKQEPMALGWVDRSVLEKPEYRVFKTTYDSVQVGAEFVDLIRKVDEGVDVTVFFGTWCGDSKREVPRFLKAADQAGIPPGRIKFYGLDRTKKSADGLTEKYGIERIPTFIFTKHDVEIGRIVEKPVSVIEADMLSILAGAQDK